MVMHVSISALLSVLSFVVSITVAWLTLFRRGRLYMTQPVQIAFVFEGDKPKVFLRTLLYATGKRGYVVEEGEKSNDARVAALPTDESGTFGIEECCCYNSGPKFPSLRSRVKNPSKSVPICLGIARKPMKRTLHLAATVFLACCGLFSFAQNTTSPTEQKPEPQTTSSGQKQEAAPNTTDAMEPLEVLTDPMGVDFKPYLSEVVLPTIRKNWYNLIPEEARAPLMKKGRLAIEFAILKNGTVAGMKFASTSGDVPLDRAAWGGISASNPFPPLPSEFGGQYLGLRITFSYNFKTSSKSGIKVSISQPDGLKVPIGGFEVVEATVTGSTNSAVKWSIAGVGCSGSACGVMSGDLYLAPKVLPSSSSVILTATSQADSTASASITVQLVKPDLPR
jgi:TonB family protein